MFTSNTVVGSLGNRRVPYLGHSGSFILKPFLNSNGNIIASFVILILSTMRKQSFQDSVKPHDTFEFYFKLQCKWN